MLDWTPCTAVERHPQKVSGKWVFRQTRVPVAALFENLDSGASVQDFLAWFPVITAAQVHEMLRYALQTLNAERQAA